MTFSCDLFVQVASLTVSIGHYNNSRGELYPVARSSIFITKEQRTLRYQINSARDVTVIIIVGYGYSVQNKHFRPITMHDHVFWICCLCIYCCSIPGGKFHACDHQIRNWAYVSTWEWPIIQLHDVHNPRNVNTSTKKSAGTEKDWVYLKYP